MSDEYKDRPGSVAFWSKPPYTKLSSKGPAMTTSLDTKNETQVDVFVKDVATSHCVKKTVTFLWNNDSRFKDLARTVREEALGPNHPNKASFLRVFVGDSSDMEKIDLYRKWKYPLGHALVSTQGFMEVLFDSYFFTDIIKGGLKGVYVSEE